MAAAGASGGGAQARGSGSQFGGSQFSPRGSQFARQRGGRSKRVSAPIASQEIVEDASLDDVSQITLINQHVSLKIFYLYKK